MYVEADTLLSELDYHYIILFFQKYYYSVTMKFILYLKTTMICSPLFMAEV